MKKLLLFVFGILIASGIHASADSIGFSYGVNFLTPSDSGFSTSHGRTTSLEWMLDEGLRLGVINEQTNLDYDGEIGNLTHNGLRVHHEVINRVNVGIGLGSATANIAGSQVTTSLVDIIGEVVIYSEEGEKISGSLVASLSARFMNTDGLTVNGDDIPNLDGANTALAVKVIF